jgi:hypothetical protein
LPRPSWELGRKQGRRDAGVRASLVTARGSGLGWVGLVGLVAFGRGKRGGPRRGVVCKAAKARVVGVGRGTASDSPRTSESDADPSAAVVASGTTFFF